MNYSGFSTGSISLETLDLISVQNGFMGGKHNHAAGTGRKHNVKNDLQHIEGGNYATRFVNYVIEYDVLGKVVCIDA